MSAAWGFIAGWLSASALFFLVAWLRYRRERTWLDAQDSEQFADGCRRFTEAGGL